MTEGKRAQECPQRRRRPDPAEQPAHPTVPQRRHVIDRVRSGHHARDQTRNLQMRVDAGGFADTDVLGDQQPEPGPLRELQNRRETGARHEVPIIEAGSEPMRNSHLPDALRAR